MTAYAAPLLSPEAERAINALGGNAARLAILGYVARNPGSLVSEIAEGTGLTISTVKVHRDALVERDLLRSDDPEVPYAERRGRHTRYTAISENIAEQDRELGKLLGLTE